MRMDAARELKQALRTGTVSLPEGIVDRPDVVSAAAAAPGAFVGIVPSADPDGFRVAVRLTQPVADTAAYAASVREQTGGGEVEIRYVGPVRALIWPTETIPAAHTPGDPGGTTPTPDPPDGTSPAPEELQQRVRPLVRGASVAHRDVSAGSVGAFVTVGDDPSIYLLSNNHVLADSDRGRTGDDVFQPGPADGGTAADRVGELFRAVRLAPDTANLVDAALARLDDDIAVDRAAHDGPLSGVRDAADVVGDVAKIGRTTGRTIGRITAIEVDGVPVGYDMGVFTFDDQIEIEGLDGGFSAGGDSGSVIYTADDRLGFGLLFAGSTTGGPGGSGVTYANPLATALSALDAVLLPAAAGGDADVSTDGDVNPVPPP